MSSRLTKFMPFLVVLVTFVFIFPNVAHGDVFFDFTFSVLGKIVYFLSYVVSLILGIGVGVEAWVVNVILVLNTQIVNSPPVKFGFPVALSLANLGFVAAIIVMAVMTILRSQTYGMKQALWKLVVAAILANFSLVIAGGILTFADRLTTYFLNEALPGGSSSESFATAIAGAFNPHKLISIDPSVVLDAETQEAIKGTFASGADIGKILALIVPLLFTVFSYLFIIITLGGLIAMLLVRYVFIGILLILMPLAWVMWIFDSTRGQWHSWWRNFLKQTFFAPLAVFFLWLAIMTSAKLSSSDPAYALSQFKQNNSIFEGLSEAIASIFSPILLQMMQVIMILGIMIGGLIAANSMGIKLAGGALGAATKLSGAFGGYVRRTGAKIATRGLGFGPTSSRGERYISALQRGPVGALGGRYLARGLQKLRVAGGEKLVGEVRAGVGKMTTDEQITAYRTLPFEKRLAVLENATKGGWIHRLDLARDLNNEAAFKRFNKSELFKDVQKGALMTGRMHDAAELMAKEGPDAIMRKRDRLGRVIEEKPASQVFKEELGELIRKLTPEDFRKLPAQILKAYDKERPYLNMSGKGFEFVRDGVIEGMAESQPGAMTRLSAKLSGADFTNFRDKAITARLKIKGIVDDIELEPGKKEKISDLLKTGDEGVHKIIEFMKKTDKQFADALNKTLAVRLTGWVTETEEKEGGKEAPPPPPGGEGKK